MHRISWRLAAAAVLLATVACRPEFQLKNLTTNEALYTASLQEYKKHHWDNAVAGFEKLTADLPARDTLLPRSYWYLASAHENSGENLLAAQSFSRLVESFPEDSLADDAQLEAARSYRKMWRKPQLDPVYGETALASYNLLIGLYPQSPLIPVAQKEIDGLQNWFAIKDFDAGMYYFRRKAFISATLYFKDVVTKYATTPTARDAALKMVAAYKADNYRDDASDLCADLAQRYPSDAEVRAACAWLPPRAPVIPDSAAAPPVKPPPPKPPASP